MIVEKSFIERLKIFGLNSYESKLWSALLSRKEAGAGELADISEVPRSRSYDVLESLEEKGFIVKQSKKPIRYVAVPPSKVLERIKSKIEEQTSEVIENLDKMGESKILSDLSELHEKGIENLETMDLSGTIKGRENIYHHLSMMMKNAKEEIFLMTTDKAINQKYEMFNKLMNDAKKKGIKLKFNIPKNSDKEIITKLKRLGEVNLSNNINRMCLIDNNEALFMVNKDDEVHKNYDLGIWVKTPYFTNFLKNMVNV